MDETRGFRLSGKNSKAISLKVFNSKTIKAENVRIELDLHEVMGNNIHVFKFEKIFFKRF